jgi:hypothetical protein
MAEQASERIVVSYRRTSARTSAAGRRPTLEDAVLRAVRKSEEDGKSQAGNVRQIIEQAVFFAAVDAIRESRSRRARAARKGRRQ